MIICLWFRYPYFPTGGQLLFTNFLNQRKDGDDTQKSWEDRICGDFFRYFFYEPCTSWHFVTKEHILCKACGIKYVHILTQNTYLGADQRKDGDDTQKSWEERICGDFFRYFFYEPCTSWHFVTKEHILCKACGIKYVHILTQNTCLGADQRKHDISTSLDFVRGIHRLPVNSPHKGLVTRKGFFL